MAPKRTCTRPWFGPRRLKMSHAREGALAESTTWRMRSAQNEPSALWRAQFPIAVTNVCAPFCVPSVNVSGTAFPGAIGGTTRLNWYRPTSPGPRPKYVSTAAVPPNWNCTGVTRLLSCCTTCPNCTPEPTGPKPMPYSTIVSPGLAGREVTPAKAPTGPTKVWPSVNVAVTYWLPPTFHAGSASSAGWSGLTVMLAAALVPFPVLTVTGCGPVPTPAGTSAFTCPGLIYETYAGTPPIVTVVPSSWFGALIPLKSEPFHVRESPAGARLLP